VTDVPDTPATTASAQSDLPATYEAARDELLEVVRHLETGGVTLEESLALWERGEALAAQCQRWLDGARARLDAAVSTGVDESAQQRSEQP
jgi:exodeoxyribonuclease VII small subunit